ARRIKRELYEIELKPSTKTFGFTTWSTNSFAKINFDATVSNNKISYGVIVRDSDGFVLGRFGGFKDEEMTAERDYIVRRRLCGIAKGGDCPEYMGRNSPLGTANKLEYFKKIGLK
ncbi:hypothetical protein Goklo_016094, partial [Gossypium klotzschianum]|nr:hypothetical protein [Gossypium klotzschianum]